MFILPVYTFMSVKWLQCNSLFVGLGGWGVKGMARHISTRYLLSDDVLPGNAARIPLHGDPCFTVRPYFEKPLALYAGLHGHTGQTQNAITNGCFIITSPVSRYQLDGRRGVEDRQGQKSSIFFWTCGPTMGPTKPSIQLEPRSLSLEVQRPVAWVWPITSFNLLPRLRMSVVTTPLPHSPSWRVQGPTQVRFPRIPTTVILWLCPERRFPIFYQ
jgi:hypothetical protein